jgi:hypothetical protein
MIDPTPKLLERQILTGGLDWLNIENNNTDVANCERFSQQ